MTSSSNSTQINMMIFEDEEVKKKKLRQMQNRQSAAQYRERKKEYLEKLEQIVDGLENDRSQLLMQTETLNNLQLENNLKICLLEEQIERAMKENRELRNKLNVMSGGKVMAVDDFVDESSQSNSNNNNTLSSSNERNKSSFHLEGRSILNEGQNQQQKSRALQKPSDNIVTDKLSILNINSLNSSGEREHDSPTSTNSNTQSNPHFSPLVPKNQQQKRQREIHLLQQQQQQMLLQQQDPNNTSQHSSISTSSFASSSPSSLSFSPHAHKLPSFTSSNLASFTPPLASFSSILSIASPSSNSPLISSLSSSPPSISGSHNNGYLSNSFNVVSSGTNMGASISGVPLSLSLPPTITPNGQSNQSSGLLSPLSSSGSSSLNFGGDNLPTTLVYPPNNLDSSQRKFVKFYPK